MLFFTNEQVVDDPPENIDNVYKVPSPKGIWSNKVLLRDMMTSVVWEKIYFILIFLFHLFCIFFLEYRCWVLSTVTIARKVGSWLMPTTQNFLRYVQGKIFKGNKKTHVLHLFCSLQDSGIATTHVPRDEYNEPLKSFMDLLDPVTIVDSAPRELGFSKEVFAKLAVVEGDDDVSEVCTQWNKKYV